MSLEEILKISLFQEPYLNYFSYQRKHNIFKQCAISLKLKYTSACCLRPSTTYQPLKPLDTRSTTPPPRTERFL